MIVQPTVYPSGIINYPPNPNFKIRAGNTKVIQYAKDTLKLAGYTEDDVKNRFGALYNAFQYGTPPHAGAAPGVDRMVMLIADSTNIREVIAFQKNKKARDLLMRAPSTVSQQQLDDVHIQIKQLEK